MENSEEIVRKQYKAWKNQCITIQENFQGGQAFYLHDGRARTLRAAIGFHGGEGSAAREAFDALSAEDQERLLRFLRSL